MTNENFNVENATGNEDADNRDGFTVKPLAAVGQPAAVGNPIHARQAPCAPVRRCGVTRIRADGYVRITDAFVSAG